MSQQSIDLGEFQAWASATSVLYSSESVMGSTGVKERLSFYAFLNGRYSVWMGVRKLYDGFYLRAAKMAYERRIEIHTDRDVLNLGSEELSEHSKESDDDG
ncbi:MAG: hypothetical protein ACR2QC_12010 [Gammaproteobacteria bacterium]